MRQVVLCDGPIKVEIEAIGSRFVLSVTNDETIRFAVARAHLEQVLQGETIQISHRGVFCKLTRFGENIQVVFAWKTRHELSTCPVAELEALLNDPEGERDKVPVAT
jgi:hypothetical protein